MRQFVQAAWLRWRALAEKIGQFQARVIFGLLYFIVVSPFAIGVRIFSDPLRLRGKPGGSNWHELSRQSLTLEDARRQF